jgi:hypothetical protein
MVASSSRTNTVDLSKEIRSDGILVRVMSFTILKLTTSFFHVPPKTSKLQVFKNIHKCRRYIISPENLISKGNTYRSLCCTVLPNKIRSIGIVWFAIMVYIMLSNKVYSPRF